MTKETEHIKEELENTYDIPFYVREDQMNGEPCYYMGPENDGEEFFCIRVSFSNKIRVTAEFLPETNGWDFIHNMGGKSAEDREVFLQYMSLMKMRGGKITLLINHINVPYEEFISYQEDWYQLEIKITKIPITENDSFFYSEVALEWGSLMMGMILSLADIDPVEAQESAGYTEGARSQVLTNRYERSRINRKLCLEQQGYDCYVCGMNFEEIYGEIGHHFIHVHHVVPVSQLGEGYVINPEKDLVPVCPNCHSMLHRKDPPFLPEELKKIMFSESDTIN